MFNNNPPPHDKAERKKFFGLTTETQNIPQEDKATLAMIESTLSMFGRSLADRVEVTKYLGPNMKKTDEYIATRPTNRPGQTQAKS